MTKETRTPFNLLLNSQEREELKALQTDTGLSGGALIRQAIHALYLHKVRHVPTCSTGQGCFVPQMHGMQMQAPSTQQLPPIPNPNLSGGN